MSGTQHPDWLREEAVRRMSSGELPIHVAADLGVGRSTAYQWRNDPTGKKNRERKKRYASRCVDCGALTNGSGGYKKQALRCGSCQVLYTAGRDGLERAEEKVREIGPLKRVSEEEIIAAIRQVANGAGSLSHEVYEPVARRLGLPSVPTITNRLGWNTAVERAGLKPTRAIRRAYPFTSADACARAVRRVGDALGNLPSCRDYLAYRKLEDPSLPSAALIRIRCGSWLDVLRMAAALDSEQVAA